MYETVSVSLYFRDFFCEQVSSGHATGCHHVSAETRFPLRMRNCWETSLDRASDVPGRSQWRRCPPLPSS
ncbi:hypothetical protein AOLI_G00181420 [Acnodon oligacanthus]